LITTACLTVVLAIWLVLGVLGTIGYFNWQDVWLALVVLLIVLLMCANVVLGIAFLRSVKMTYQKLLPNACQIQFV
jgi:hypothetical protein